MPQAPYLIDGDPHDAEPIHVRVLQKALTVFWSPIERGEHSDDESTCVLGWWH